MAAAESYLDLIEPKSGNIKGLGIHVSIMIVFEHCDWWDFKGGQSLQRREMMRQNLEKEIRGINDSAEGSTTMDM